jgi:hypothetical protein
VAARRLAREPRGRRTGSLGARPNQSRCGVCRGWSCLPSPPEEAGDPRFR